MWGIILNACNFLCTFIAKFISHEQVSDSVNFAGYSGFRSAARRGVQFTKIRFTQFISSEELQLPQF
jgi:hypothetical protein